MGFMFNFKHTNDLNICVTTKSIGYIASKRSTSVTVQGRDGQYIFEDGYDNIQIEFDCVIVDDDLINRRARSREIAAWLSESGSGDLFLDYDSDTVYYRVLKTVSNINALMERETSQDKFTIIFECAPLKRGCRSRTKSFWSVTSGTSLDIYTEGTYKMPLLIKLQGDATSISIGSFTYSNLYGTVYIDSANLVVYELNGQSKINKIGNFSGDFFNLQPGSNNFTITGDIASLHVVFKYEDRYI